MLGPKDEAMARQWLRQACEFGVASACPPGETSPILIPTATAGASNR
jgi:hypothetical protein